jgi:hypothetical protein
MLTINLALVSISERREPSDTARVAAALQRQITRDFGPLWDVHATLDAFPELRDVPPGYWPILVMDDINTPGAAGVHMDKNGQPFALVAMSDSWSLTASHEALEMLGDPFGNRLIAGPSPKPGQGRVEFLVEVCDPPESDDFAYTVNDVLVSDFYTPRFFDPTPVAGGRYSFTGALTAPRQILRGGYLSWHEPISDHWWQQTWFDGDAPKFRDLGVFDAKASSLRTWIDGQSPLPGIDDGLPTGQPALVSAVALGDQSREVGTARADALQAHIATILGR